MSVGTRERLSLLCLMAATFFLPLGYDVVFKILLDWLDSYWLTTCIFYCLSGLFFGLYFYFSRGTGTSIIDSSDP